MDIAILLDGDYTRRMIKRRIGRNPSYVELEQFCRLCIQRDERIVKAYYYDCPPFGEIRKLPVSGCEKNFSYDPVYQKALAFQKELSQQRFFTFRKGTLSFDGWKIKEDSMKELILKHRMLRDDDFDPVLTQKQVDMKIGLDIATISLKRSLPKILLATADADFIPAIHFGRSKGLEVILISDGHSTLKIKAELIKSCNGHRIIQ